MTAAQTMPLTPFVDGLPLPERLLARERNGRLTVRVSAGSHSFHRDLPESRVWGYDGTVPGPTIEAERGHPVRVNGATRLTVGCPSPWRSPATRSRPTACPCSAVPSDSTKAAG